MTTGGFNIPACFGVLVGRTLLDTQHIADEHFFLYNIEEYCKDKRGSL